MQKHQCLCKTLEEVLTGMHRKFSDPPMIQGVVSSEGNLMLLYFFLQGAIVNAVAYTKVLKLWIDFVVHERRYVFQHDSAPNHTAHTTEYWVAKNFHVIPSSSNANPMDYYV